MSREFGGDAADSPPVWQNQAERQMHIHAYMTSALPCLPGNRCSHQQNHEVVDSPRRVDDHGVVVFRIAPVARNRSVEAGDVKGNQRQERQRNPTIEIRASDNTALAGDIELSKPGINQRQQRWKQNVWRQHGFVNFIPERKAVESLYSRVSLVGNDDVRQSISEYRQRITVDVHDPEQEVNQWNR